MSRLPQAEFRLRVVSPSDDPTGDIEPSTGSAAGPPVGAEPSDELAQVIKARISDRLGSRIHELDVSVEAEAIVLRGYCATYYTKQLAQHAALGVLNDEQLDNRISVTQG